MNVTGTFVTISVQHFADGVTVARDSMGEFDTYFDRQRWEATIPEIWGDSLFPPNLENYNIGVLCGVGSAPQISSFAMALQFAKRNLKPKNDDKWHKKVPAPQTSI